MHIDAVIAQIETYSASIGKPITVVEFGASDRPPAPYVVVKQEPGAFRIIGHFLPGQQSALRLFMRRDIQNALLDQTVGGVTRLHADPLAAPGTIINANDDGTISQERLFLTADRIF